MFMNMDGREASAVLPGGSFHISRNARDIHQTGLRIHNGQETAVAAASEITRLV